MNKKIHPKYEIITIQCSCGNKFNTKSTKCNNIKIEVCSLCHPFYTGKQRFIDTSGRIDNFKKRFGNTGIDNIYKKINKDYAKNKN